MPRLTSAATAECPGHAEGHWLNQRPAGVVNWP